MSKCIPSIIIRRKKYKKIKEERKKSGTERQVLPDLALMWSLKFWIS
jgi:hypothetical protein